MRTFLTLAIFLLSTITLADELKPIRQAKVRAIATKVVIEKTTDGSFGAKMEQICDITSNIPVYQIEKDSGVTISSNTLGRCPVDLRIGKATLVMVANILIQKAQTDEFHSEPIDLKSFSSGFWVQNDSGFFKVGSFPLQSTEDLTLKTLTTTMSSSDLSKNNRGEESFEEVIYVRVRFED